MRGLKLLAGTALAFGLGLASAGAAEFEIKVMHFLPPQAPAQTLLIEPWAKAVEEQSGGRIDVTIYPAMQLGGKPPQLIDQVRDGVVEVVWTLPSYTAGRFPIISAFELPFMVSDAKATSQAVQEFAQAYAMEEFSEVHPLLFHVHDRGLLHSKTKQIMSVEDFKGMKLRAPSRSIGDALAAFGAEPIFMPVPQMPEALSKGVIDGAVVPWEITLPLKLSELVTHHTEIEGPRGLYTSVFVFAMNKDFYASLPDDLKAVIDANSGMNIAARIGEAWDKAEEPGRAKALAAGNTITVMPDAEVQKMMTLSQGVIDAWVAEMDAKGKDGKAMLEAARALIDKYGS
jgi:TRAP-type C4-dicarboxylate transport system substrate-binding protein